LGKAPETNFTLQDYLSDAAKLKQTICGNLRQGRISLHSNLLDQHRLI